MKFPRFWEHRSSIEPSGSYTTDVLNFLSASVSGQALRGVPAAIEICAGVWQRGMATAEVSPMNGRTAALTSSTLGYIGRYLLRYGEVLFEIGVRGGEITLTPAQSWTVAGGITPASWMYEATFQGPSTSVVRTLPAGRVLHLMYSQSHHAPWLGVGPLSAAGVTQELVGQIETALAEEAGTAHGYNFAVPDVRQAGQLTTELRGAARGALHLVPSVHLTLQPIGRVIAQQIGDALDVDGLTFDFSGIGAADIAAKARAWGTLTKGGVSPQDAGAITGLPIDDAEAMPAPPPAPAPGATG